MQMTTDATQLKRCTCCKQEKPLTAFAKSRQKKDGLQPFCKECSSAYVGEWQRTEKGKLSRQQAKLKLDFGLSFEEYQHLLASQNGGCAICGEQLNGKALDVDHDHVTGKVRGLLCNKHNQALGLFNDDPTLLEMARQYLLRHATE